MEDLSRQNQDLNGLKARLTQENFELQRQVQELDGSTGALAKAKSQLQSQVDDLKSKLDEETRVSNAICKICYSGNVNSVIIFATNVANTAIVHYNYDLVLTKGHHLSNMQCHLYICRNFSLLNSHK